MSFTVEDGSGIVGANSYLSTAAADIYWADRNNSDWAAATLAVKEGALIAASQYLDVTYRWKGRKGSSGQGLDWPRGGVLDDEGLSAGGSALPTAVIAATAELALEALAERLLPGQTRGGAVKREKVRVDVIAEEQEYFEGAPSGRSFPLVDRLLAGLIVGRTGRGATRLRRA